MCSECVMLRIFKRSESQPDINLDEPIDLTLQPQVIQDALAKAAAERPYIYQQVTGRDLHANIVDALSVEPEGRGQTALGVMGSLAGFACLSSVYLKFERGEISPEQIDFRVGMTEEGRRLFFGDMVNEPLFRGEMSLWSLVVEAAQKLGATHLPDIEEVFSHVVQTANTQDYGDPRLSDEYLPRDLPSNFVRYLMPSYLPMLARYDADADKFPISFGYAIQMLMEDYADEIEPDMAAQIVIECAVPMSTLDPASVF